MTRLTMPKSHRTAHHTAHRIPVREPDESDGAPMPIEPDEGLVPPMIPDDPEHDRMIDPE